MKWRLAAWAWRFLTWLDSLFPPKTRLAPALCGHCGEGMVTDADLGVLICPRVWVQWIDSEVEWDE